MRFHAASISQRLLKGFAVGFAESTMGASKDFVALFLGTGREAMHGSCNFDLLAQRQILNTPNDGFDDSHFATN
jgi:hypothetical protein